MGFTSTTTLWLIEHGNESSEYGNTLADYRAAYSLTEKALRKVIGIILHVRAQKKMHSSATIRFACLFTVKKYQCQLVVLKEKSMTF